MFSILIIFLTFFKHLAIPSSNIRYQTLGACGAFGLCNNEIQRRCGLEWKLFFSYYIICTVLRPIPNVNKPYYSTSRTF